MKVVIPYSRVSSDEQVQRHSLSDQDARLTEYANRNNLVIAARFQDDHTAKTFKRPGFQKMLAFIKSNKVDEIIFIKWTRFSRILTDALLMIEKLKSMGVSVQAIDEPIDFDVPQSHYLVLPVYLGIGQADNVVKADLVTRGIRRAKLQGKWVNHAPLGYLNSRDAKNKPLIVIDEVNAPKVKRLFELMATGNYSQDQIRVQLRKEGLKVSKTRLSLMLKNPVYCGNIYLKAYKKDQEQTVKGVHQPIIDEGLFYRVQQVIIEHKRVKSKKYRKATDDFPLNGFIYCDYDHKMTFSKSRGRHGGYFHYYHCPNHLHCSRCRANDVNESFVKHLSTFKADEQQIGHFRMIYEYAAKQDFGNVKSIQSTIRQQEQRIEILQDKLVDGIIPDADYQQMRTRYENELFNLKEKVAFIQERESEITTDIECSSKLLSDIAGYYTEATTEGKREIVSCLITPAGRIYYNVETKKCRTPVVDPLISMILNNNTGLKEPKVLNLQGYGGTFAAVAWEEHHVEPYSLRLSLHRIAEAYKKLIAA